MLYVMAITDTRPGQTPVVADSIAHWFDFCWMLYAPGEWTAQAIQARDEREPDLGGILYALHSQHRDQQRLTVSI